MIKLNCPIEDVFNRHVYSMPVEDSFNIALKFYQNENQMFEANFQMLKIIKIYQQMLKGQKLDNQVSFEEQDTK